MERSVGAERFQIIRREHVAGVRTPTDADQRSEVMPITIPNLCRSPFRGDADHRSELMPITLG